MKRMYGIGCSVLSLLMVLVCLPCHAQYQQIRVASTTTIRFLLLDAATGQTGQTGQAANITLKVRYGSTSATGLGTITEVDAANFPGIYAYTPTSTETGTTGYLLLHATCPGCQVKDREVQIVAFDPNDASVLGLTGVGTLANQTSQNSTLATLLNATVPYSSTVNDGASTTTVIDTALTGTADLTGSKVIFTTGALKGVYRTISSMNTGTGQITFLSALPSAPVNGVAFSIVSGSKAMEQFLAALGTDSKVILSNNAHIGAVIPRVTLTDTATNTTTLGGLAPPANFNLLGISGAGALNVSPLAGFYSNLPAVTTTGNVLTAADVTRIWQDATAGDFTVANSAGLKLFAAGSAGDPWTTALPGAYGAGTAGNIVGLIIQNALKAAGATAPSWYATAPAGWLDSTSIASIVAGLNASIVDGSLTFKQCQELNLALQSDAVRTYNAVTHTATATWYRRATGALTADLTKPVIVKTTVYDSADKQIMTTSTAINASNL